MHLRNGVSLRPVWAALAVCAALLTVPGCATLGGQDAPVIRAKDKVAPALVHIRPVKEVFAGGKKTEMLAVGSGFIISPDGYVVTNEHVAGESSSVQCVLSDHREVGAKVVGVDADTDIAVLKLDTTEKLPWVRMGRSANLEAGQTVLALGSPHGLARSVSKGIVSVTNRYLGGDGPMESPFNDWIQTDAAINPGNSGGPLVNLKGDVVGVNARVLSGAENVGFAIPIDTAREVVEAIIRDGRVHRSWIGVTFQEMLAKTDDPSQRGVVISDVDRLSPATEAGVKPGDVLVSINGQEVNARFEEDLPAVRKAVANLAVGSTAVLSLRRGEEKVDIPVKTEEKTAQKGSQAEFGEWGFTALEVTPEVARRAQLPERTGILVSGASPGGIAARAGLQEGDIVLLVDGQKAADLEAFKVLYNERREAQKKLVMLFVQRGALTRFVLINATAEAPQPEEENAGHAE
jgi:serine protease Do